jgi:hypothetical protein
MDSANMGETFKYDVFIIYRKTQIIHVIMN